MGRFLIVNENNEYLKGSMFPSGQEFIANKWNAKHFKNEEEAIEYIYDNELFDCRVEKYGDVYAH